MLPHTGRFLLFAFVQLVYSQLNFDDPCNLITWSDLSKDETNVVKLEIPKGCPQGQVDWNYPKGYLHLTASRPDSEFSLCIEQSWATMIDGVTDITAGHNTTFPLPKEGQASCTNSVHKQVDLLIKAQSSLFYMTAFSFSTGPH